MSFAPGILKGKSAVVTGGATGIGRMRWPVRGRVISKYGNGGGKSNDGIDILVPEGTPGSVRDYFKREDYDRISAQGFDVEAVLSNEEAFDIF